MSVTEAYVQFGLRNRSGASNFSRHYVIFLELSFLLRVNVHLFSGL